MNRLSQDFWWALYASNGKTNNEQETIRHVIMWLHKKQNAVNIIILDLVNRIMIPKIMEETA